MRFQLAVSVLVLGVLPLAGCLSSGGVRADPSEGVPATGTLRGVVHSDASLALPGARVSLARTSLFQVTTAAGAFEFTNLTVGEYVVRVESTGFQVLENATRVSAGNVTEMVVFLVPAAGTGAGYRPHPHDLWLGRDEVTIMDQEHNFNEPGRTSGIGGPAYYRATSTVVHPNRNSTDADMPIRIPKGDQDPGIIFPGTREVRVTISWDASDGSLAKVLLKYSPAKGGEKRVLARLPSGGTWRIPVGPGEADTGHQEFTLWSFWMNPAQDPLVDGAAYRPGLLLGPLHVKVVIVRGQLYSEDAHEDFWGGKTELVVTDHDRTRDCNSAYRIIERSTNPCLAESGIKPVPPGTQRLKVEMKWTYSQADGVAPSDLVIVWRTAAQSRHTTSAMELNTGPGQAPAAQTRTCEIVLKEGETDAFYQSYSLWAFGYAVKGHEKDEFDFEPRPLRMSFRVVAVRDAAYEGGAV